jgi:hypothetical protein
VIFEGCCGCCACGCCAWVGCWVCCCAGCCACVCEGAGIGPPRAGTGPLDGNGPRLGNGEAGVFLTGKLLCVLCGTTSFAVFPAPSPSNSFVNPSTKTNLSCIAKRCRSIPAPLLASVLQNSKSRSHDTRTTIFSSSCVASSVCDVSVEETKALRKRRVTSQWGVESRTPVRRSWELEGGRRR